MPREIKPVKEKRSIKVPLGKKYFTVIKTTNLYSGDIEKLEELCNKIDWDNAKFVFLPSEFIESIKFYKKKWLRKNNDYSKNRR